MNDLSQSSRVQLLCCMDVHLYTVLQSAGRIVCCDMNGREWVLLSRSGDAFFMTCLIGCGLRYGEWKAISDAPKFLQYCLYFH
jgi:hypothetical protein